MLRLATPVLVEQFLHMLVGFSDTILAGQYLGATELAAINLMNYALWALYTVFAIVAIGSTALVARSVGGGDFLLARRVLRQSLLLGVLLAVAVAAVGVVLAGPVVRLMQLEGDAARLATHYLWFVLAVLVAIGVEEVAIACLRGAGDTMSGLIAMIVLNIVNVSVSWSLVLGLGPLPELGWYGLAIGTAVGHLCGAAVILGFLLRGRAGLWIELRRARATPLQQTSEHRDDPSPPARMLDGEIVRRLLRVGLPGGIDSLAMVCFHLWYLAIINQLGELAMAAHGVGVRIESISYLPGFAFQVAAATLVGQYLGAGDPHRAGRAVLTTCAVGGSIMTCAGAVMFFFPEALARIFIHADKQSIIELTSRLLPIVGAAIPAFALATVLTGALRGAGDTRLPLAITFVGLVLVRIPMAYILAYETIELPLVGVSLVGWGLGVVGAWYAMVVDIVVRTALILLRFFHGGWKRIEV
jgi:putative MATE family efflux protein